jgi:hypothetical protein
MRAPNVAVTVNGELWQFVSNLADAGPDDRDFTVTQTPNGNMVIGFGDGIHGAPPPTGSEIMVQYQSGEGASGNTVNVTIGWKLTDPTFDEALWFAIRNRDNAVSVEFSKRP